MSDYVNYISPQDPANQDSVIHKFPLPGYSKENVSVKIAKRLLLIYVTRNGKQYLAYRERLSSLYTPTTRVQAHMNDGMLKVYFHYENPVREISVY
jgi:HSP20 family molecular chaperone IbpA